MFGAKEERASNNIQAGINEGLGFKLTTFFEKLNRTSQKTGEPYTVYELAWNNGLNMSKWYFPPSKRQPNDNDRKNLEDKNTSERKKAEEKGKTFTPMTLEEFMQNKFNNAVDDFLSIINMIWYSYYPAESEELKELRKTLPSFETAEEMVANLDQYLAAAKNTLPENYQSEDWDIILGRTIEETFLSPPGKMFLTGRFAKLSKDETRTLTIKDSYFQDQIEHIGTQAKSEAPKPKDIGWG